MRNLINRAGVLAATATLDALDKLDAIEAIRECDHAEFIVNDILADLVIEGRAVTMDDHQSAIDDATDGATEAIEKLAAFEADAERLHEMVAEGRRDDAIALLGELTEQRFRTVAEQRNLFPDRIPA